MDHKIRGEGKRAGGERIKAFGVVDLLLQRRIRISLAGEDELEQPSAVGSLASVIGKIRL